MALSDTKRRGDKMDERERSWGLPDWLRYPHPILQWAVVTVLVVVWCLCAAAFFCLVRKKFGAAPAKHIPATVTDEDLRTLLLAIGGVAAIPFVIWKQLTEHAAQQTGRQTFVASRIAAAAADLGHDITLEKDATGSVQVIRTEKCKSSVIRLAAINTLHSLGRETPRDFHTISNILATHCRLTEDPVEMMRAFEVLGERDRWPHKGKLSDADLVDLRDLRLPLVPDPDAIQKLAMPHAFLSGFHVEGRRYTHYRFNHCMFSDASFSGIVRRADADGFEATDCSFTATAFKAANLQYAKFIRCRFQSADFSGADLSGARFEDCQFSHVSLVEALLAGAAFIGRVDLSADDLAKSIRSKNTVLPDALHNEATRSVTDEEAADLWETVRGSILPA